MAIREESDPLSRATMHEKNYFKVRDPNASNLDFNRFLFMKPGEKDQCYDWRINWKKQDIPSSIFKINQPKFVNRPDSIAYATYGNSKYWWIIAMVNDVINPFSEFYLGRELIVPDLQATKKLLGF